MTGKKVFADHRYFSPIVRLSEAREALDRAIIALKELQPFNAACDLRKVLQDIAEALPGVMRK